MEEEQLIRIIKCCLIFNKHSNYNLDILHFIIVLTCQKYQLVSQYLLNIYPE